MADQEEAVREFVAVTDVDEERARFFLDCTEWDLQTRQQHGEYHRLVQELRLDGERFQRYFRMDRAQFDELLARVGPQITQLDTNWQSPISA
ncbi:hypothetical protein AAFF_G00198120 [Aldrovandia affinis]|uniref:Uncharacterized protein n=1 Tax=Aldrovandia affinis TaxID=143900 RepID=A0AAD7W635_9TELE|nr:hypothetical protein AAFF_G00198120 [Aldrovandia affinis]